jgi:hypothetical protein
MNKLILVLIAGLALAGPLGAQRAKEIAPVVRFQAVDIYVDSVDQPLAAYQIELAADTEAVKIVGVEGGEHPAYQEAPYYDPRAIQREQVVIAAFNTASADNLPTGRTRIATVHLQIGGDADPGFIVRLKTAATLEGERVPAEVTAQERNDD